MNSDDCVPSPAFALALKQWQAAYSFETWVLERMHACKAPEEYLNWRERWLAAKKLACMMQVQMTLEPVFLERVA